MIWDNRIEITADELDEFLDDYEVLRDAIDVDISDEDDVEIFLNELDTLVNHPGNSSVLFYNSDIEKIWDKYEDEIIEQTEDYFEMQNYSLTQIVNEDYKGDLVIEYAGIMASDALLRLEDEYSVKK